MIRHMFAINKDSYREVDSKFRRSFWCFIGIKIGVHKKKPAYCPNKNVISQQISSMSETHGKYRNQSTMATTSTYAKQYLTEEKIASEPWPDDAILYQPYEVEQILLAENASCLAVKAYLKMCNIPFTVRSIANAEFMSPGGQKTKLPFVKVGAFIIAEFEPIVNFVEQKELAIGQWLNEDEKYDLRAYVSLVEHIFTSAELYITFLDKEVYETVTQPRNGCVFPWPLNRIQNMKKRKHVLNQLQVYQWKDMDLNNVLGKVEKCCEALTSKLEENGSTFFYGEEPTELDAIIFGHLFTILTTKLPNNELAKTIQGFRKLVEFCQKIDNLYFRTK